METIAIVSGTYLQLPLVLKAKEMGLRTICFMWEDGAVCKEYVDRFYPISIIEKERILDICREEKIKGIVTIASDLAVQTVNYVADKLGLVGNPNDYSLVTTNKFLMRECFFRNNIPSPRFIKVTDTSFNQSELNLCYPLIVKPTDRSGSRGVEKVDTEGELKAAVERAFSESFKHEAIIEEFIEGREVSVETISWEGKHYVLQITDKVTTGAPYFVELEHHQPTSLSTEIKKNIHSVVLKALTALNIKYGASHSELMITDSGDIKVVEIGARMGGDFIGSTLVKLSTGYDFLAGVIKVAMGTFEEPKITEESYSGVYFLSKETERLLPFIKNFREYPEIVEAAITSSTLKSIQSSGDRSGYFIYKSKEGRFSCFN